MKEIRNYQEALKKKVYMEPKSKVPSRSAHLNSLIIFGILPGTHNYIQTINKGGI